jgi:hypothetical protein
MTSRRIGHRRRFSTDARSVPLVDLSLPPFEQLDRISRGVLGLVDSIRVLGTKPDAVLRTAALFRPQRWKVSRPAGRSHASERTSRSEIGGLEVIPVRHQPRCALRGNRELARSQLDQCPPGDATHTDRTCEAGFPLISKWGPTEVATVVKLRGPTRRLSNSFLAAGVADVLLLGRREGVQVDRWSR